MFLVLCRRIDRNARRCLKTLTLTRRTAVSQTAESPGDVQQRVAALAHNLKKNNRVCKVDLLKILDSVQHKDLPATEDVDFWSLLLRSCGHAMPDEAPPVRMELARRCWSELRRVTGSPPPLELHNEFLRCHVENSPADFSVAGFLETLGGAQPDERTFDLLLEAAAAGGDLAQVVEVVSLMKRRGLPAREHTFNNLLRCHARRGDRESFLQTLDTMRLAQVAPTADTFSRIALGFCEAGDVAAVKETFRYAGEAGVTLTREDHALAIVRAAASTGDEGLLKEVFRLTRVRDLPLTDAVVNLTVHLVHAGCERAACLLFREVTSRFPPDTQETSRSGFGVFLLRELVRTGKPAELVKDLCSALEDSGQNEWATSKAVEAALVLGREGLALSLLEALGDKGGPLRQHYFWPLFVTAAGEEGALEVLRRMLLLGVRPDHETLTDYVLPRVSFAADVMAATRRLQDLGLTVAELAPAVLVTLLKEGRLEGAASLVSTLKFKANRRQLVRPLASAFRSSGDAKATAALLKLLLPRSPPSEDLVGQFLLEVAPSKKSKVRAGQFLDLLKALGREKLSVGGATAGSIRRKLRGLPEERELLGALEGLAPEGPGGEDNGWTAIPHPRDMSLEELECHLVELRSKNMNTRGVLRRLLQEYCRVKDFARASEVAQALSESAAPLSPGMLASLVEVHCRTGDLDQAEACLRKLGSDFPGFQVDAYKVVDLATALVLDGRLPAAEALLEQRGAPSPPPPPDLLSANCRRLLDAAASKQKNPEDVRRLLELLAGLGYCRVTNALLGPLVRAHLLAGDPRGAVDEFARCVEELGGGGTPLLHELLLAALDSEELLGRAASLAEGVHGRDAALVALAAALAEGGRGDRLRALLSAGGEGVARWWPALLRRCERFADEGKLRPLEEVAEAAKGAAGLDIAAVYTLVMRVLYRRGDREGADALWQKLQEEDVVPEERFVAMAKDLLRGRD